jgi:hypothetical protein
MKLTQSRLKKVSEKRIYVKLSNGTILTIEIVIVVIMAIKKRAI